MWQFPRWNAIYQSIAEVVELASNFVQVIRTLRRQFIDPFYSDGSCTMPSCFRGTHKMMEIVGEYFIFRPSASMPLESGKGRRLKKFRRSPSKTVLFGDGKRGEGTEIDISETSQAIGFKRKRKAAASVTLRKLPRWVPFWKEIEPYRDLIDPASAIIFN